MSDGLRSIIANALHEWNPSGRIAVQRMNVEYLPEERQTEYFAGADAVIAALLHDRDEVLRAMGGECTGWTAGNTDGKSWVVYRFPCGETEDQQWADQARKDIADGSARARAKSGDDYRRILEERRGEVPG